DVAAIIWRWPFRRSTRAPSTKASRAWEPRRVRWPCRARERGRAAVPRRRGSRAPAAGRGGASMALDERRTDVLAWALAGCALANFATAIWMRLAPADWYRRLPAAVPDTGPLNEHFVRDLGGTFAMMGCALLAGALWPALRAPALAFVSLFYVLHALVHVT